ncbi:MAG: hypothetical protein LBU64_09825 [Planctomycetota bacterium]|jgi:alpha-beta hydrolase superfamily lysophospholipase|nr:hypothetical protein [Planctomycetota bacterium]
MRTITRLAAVVLAAAFPQSPFGASVAGEGAPDNLERVFRIDRNTVENYSYNNKSLISGQVKAVAIDFQGLNYGALKTEPNPMDEALAAKSVLVIQPWPGPWHWSNFQAIRQTDLIIAATREKYGIGGDVPVVVYGRSMGGVSAYNYAVYGEFPVAGVAGNCPVTDLAHHATERPDVARGIYRAFAHYDSGVALAVAWHNPAALVDKLPKVPYFVISTDTDESVDKEAHADRFVAALRAKNHSVEYLVVPGMTHVEFDIPGRFDKYPDVLKRYIDFIAGFAR